MQFRTAWQGKGVDTRSLAGPTNAPISSQARKEALNNTPIEIGSLFSVKKRVPNPQVPEPGRMLLRQKNECKCFLILMQRIFHIDGSGTKVLACNRRFLALLPLRINSRNSGDVRE